MKVRRLQQVSSHADDDQAALRTVDGDFTSVEGSNLGTQA